MDRALREQCGNAYSSLTLRVSEILGSFDVASGQLTNLGTLVVQSLKDPAQAPGLSDSYLVERSDRQDDLGALVRVRVPRLVESIRVQHELSWRADAFAEGRAAVLRRLRASALPRGFVALGSGDAFLAYGRLGQIFLRNEAQR